MKALALQIDEQQLQAIRERMDEANQRAHFVIFQSVERESGKVLRLITDIDSFRAIQEQHQDDSDMVIIQDIVPITDTLARWAVAENMAAQQGDNAEVLADLERYTNEVLKENHQTVNPPESTDD
ncbi:hypothetical protein ACN50C_09490 [Levilactobacillus brevis]|uniref:Uncharacterized protein n=3 Tax=Levilactobacillus brevis TaxID=1580 RepID=U2PMU3_LEVBR|nr:hypothetical protein [Levilactobacillus brevis]BAN07982.1 conserved hypothetical protein [Levilactobacillus brevis KB290]ARW23269.1 hypothetical protein S101174_02464 [Levilactobacillus brevis]ARW49627.1 hypothetical protein S101106_00099 [Levilactobacillus brevis]ERK45441.1 hypothetical protein HMPREF0495_00293 [Levilactobacillus brevis ATCC 14869 = DSM 20054]KID43708.1 hypothetical protein LbDm2_1875 [Levilactobacillus brevis]